MVDQGPHDFKPADDVPILKYAATGHRRWAQIKSGKWMAFYCKVGPDDIWNVEHPEDPNWWGYGGDDYKKKWTDVWACRHGAYKGSLDKPSCSECGTEPFSRQEFEAAKLNVIHLLDGIL